MRPPLGLAEGTEVSLLREAQPVACFPGEAGCGRRRWASYAEYSDSNGSIPTSVRLSPEMETRLDRLAKGTGRTRAYYLRELIEQGIDDLEDANHSTRPAREPA